ncbi:MAG: thioredoxin [Micromonosporaceae bacterium]|nr:thioredoxin [Micromonosporaceae bacterium]
MATVELTKDNFLDTTEKNDMVVIDFWADWCRPCHMFAPIFEEASERYPDVVFGKIDTEAQPELSEAYEIRSIPTVIFVRDGAIVHQQAGALPPQILDRLIDQVRQLDMDAVRAEAE